MYIQEYVNAYYMTNLKRKYHIEMRFYYMHTWLLSHIIQVSQVIFSYQHIYILSILSNSCIVFHSHAVP